MKIFVESTDSGELVRYDVSSMDVFKVMDIKRTYPNNVRTNQVGNYETYKIIGTAAEVNDVIDYCKSKGITPRKRPVNSADVKWYNAMK